MSGSVFTFFDLDGPILDVSEKFYRVYADLVTERGGQPIPKDDYWEQKRRRIPDAVILRASGLEDWTEEYRALRRARIETPEYLRCDRVWPGVPRLLAALRARGPVVLVTLRNSAEALVEELRAFGLYSLFERVLSAGLDEAGGEGADLKTALVRGAFGADDLTGWFVGDTETDVRAGQRLGLRTAAVTYGIRTEEHLSALKPDVLLHSPERLVQWAETLL